MNIQKESFIIRSMKALTWAEGKLVICNGNKVYIFDPITKQKKYLVTIPYRKKFQLFAKIGVLNRLLRLNIPYGYFSEKLNILFITAGGYIYEIDIQNGFILGSWQIANGDRVLNLTEIYNLPGFNDGIYFGEYYNNAEYKPVSIFHRKSIAEWQPVLTFEKYEFYHIHNLIPDYYRNCVWCFTGDLDEHSIIWKIESKFTIKHKVFAGKQMFRSCTGIVLEDRLVYATDSQFETNYLCEIVFEENESIHNKLFELEGSVIYGNTLQNSFLFSTAVEPGEFVTKFSMKRLVNRTRGPGIKSNYAKIMLYECNTSTIKEVYKNEKDFLPFYLFQYGVLIFPSNCKEADFLSFYSTGLKINDCSTTLINITI